MVKDHATPVSSTEGVDQPAGSNTRLLDSQCRELGVVEATRAPVATAAPSTSSASSCAAKTACASTTAEGTPPSTRPAPSTSTAPVGIGRRRPVRSASIEPTSPERPSSPSPHRRKGGSETGTARRQGRQRRRLLGLAPQLPGAGATNSLSSHLLRPKTTSPRGPRSGRERPFQQRRQLARDSTTAVLVEIAHNSTEARYPLSYELDPTRTRRKTKRSSYP